jgi:hypothetical protein
MKLTVPPPSPIVDFPMTRTPKLLVLAFCAFAAAAFAQPAPTVEMLGAVKEVHGVVTMSFGSQVATVQPETPVFDGARFVAGSSGSAQLSFQGGCVLDLKPNEWVTIDKALSCQQQVAAIQTLTNVAGAGLFASPHTLPLLGISTLTGVVAKEFDITSRPK